MTRARSVEFARFGERPDTFRGPLPGTTIGLEWEFELRDGARPVPFAPLLRTMIARAPDRVRVEIGGRARLAGGQLLMADGDMVEIAGAPEPVGPRLAARLERSLASAAFDLRRSLAAIGAGGLSLIGRSTHVNVACAFVDGEALARDVAERYAPLLAALSNDPPVLGLIVRPRPRRLEIVTDALLDRERLALMLVATVGAFRAAFDRRTGLVADDGPRLAASVLARARTRPGWRMAVAPIPDRGRARDVALPLAGGGSLTLRDWMTGGWHEIRPFAARVFGPAEIADVDATVAGRRRVAFENRGRVPPLRPRRAAPTPAGEAHRRALSPRMVDGWRIEPAFPSWEFVALQARRGRAVRFVALPRHLFAAWADGRLDAMAAAALRRRGAGRDGVLRGAGQGGRFAVFTALDTAALAADLEYARQPRSGRERALPKKPPPRRRDSCCQVIPIKGGYDIRVPPTGDPLQIVQRQEPPRNAAEAGLGVFLGTGAFHHHRVDHRVRALGFDFSFARHHRTSIDYDGTLGRNWDHGYDIRVVPEIGGPGADGCLIERFPEGGGGGLRYYDGTGRMTRHAFADWTIRSLRWCDGSFDAIVTSYAQTPGESFEIQRYAVLPGSAPPAGLVEPIFYRVRLRGGVRYLLNCHGYVVEIRDRNRNRMRFEYGWPGNPKTGYLVLRRIRDTVGRRYFLDYDIAPDGMPRLISVTEFDGKRRSWNYAYDPSWTVLETVTLVTGRAGTPRLRYDYHQGPRPGLMTAVVGPVEMATPARTPWLVNRFAGSMGDERVVAQRVGAPPGTTPSCGGEYGFVYGSGGEVKVTARDGALATFIVRDDLVVERRVADAVFENGVFDPARVLATRFAYDPNFHLEAMELPGGGIRRFRYLNRNQPVLAGEERDSVSSPEFTHANDLGRDDLLREWFEAPGGVGTMAIATHRHEKLFNAPTATITPHGTTRRSYRHGFCARPQDNGNPWRIIYPRQRQPSGPSRPVIEIYAYGLGGNVVARIDPDDVVHGFDLHETGQVAVHRVGGRHSEGFVYDAVGNAIQRTDARNALWEMEYDDRDNLMLELDPLRHRRDHAYDLEDRRVITVAVRTDDPTTIAGIAPSPSRTHVTRTVYDLLGQRRELHTDIMPVGAARARRWECDGEGRLTLAESPRAVSGTAPNAHTRSEHNARGLLAKVTRADGDPAPSVWRHDYDADGRLARNFDPGGRETRFERDPFGRIAAIRGPDGTDLHHEYDGPFRWREWVEGPVAVEPGVPAQRGVLAERHFVYDAAGREIVRRELIFEPLQRPSVAPAPGGPVGSLAASAALTAGPAATERVWYTPGGRVRSVERPGGALTMRQYDFADFGQVRRIDLPGGHHVELDYEGPLLKRTRTVLRAPAISLTDAPVADLALEETQIFDELGRPLTRTDAHGLITAFAYDSFDGLRAELTPAGLRTIEYDVFGRIARRSIRNVRSLSNLAGVSTQSFEHDLNDNPVAAVDHLGRRSESSFDAHDRVATRREPDRPEASMTWRPDDRIERIVAGASRAIAFEHGNGAVPEKITTREGNRTNVRRFGADGLGRIVWATDDNGGAADRVRTIRRLDSLGRILDERTAIPEFGFERSIAYGYDADFARKTILYPDAAPELALRFDPDGGLAQLDRNGRRLLSRASLGPGRAVETRIACELTVTDPNPRRFAFDVLEAWRYDAAGRPEWRSLRFWDAFAASPGWLSLAWSETLVYDPTSGFPTRRGLGGAHTDAARRLPGATTLRHDGAARLVSQRDEIGGDLLLREFDWDGGNRLHGIVETSVAGGVATQRRSQVDWAAGTRPLDRDVASRTETHEWRFDAQARLRSDEYERRSAATGAREFGMRRRFEFDPCDRLALAQVGRIPLDYVEWSAVEYLYDAFGRLVSRFSDFSRDYGRRIFVHDGPRCIAEYAVEREPGGGHRIERAATNVYDEQDRLLVHQTHLGPAADRLDLVALPTTDGTPLLSLRRRSSVATLPPWAGGDAAARVRWFAERLPVIAEEQRPSPFAEAAILRYDAASGAAAPVERPLIPIVIGGRRHFAHEGLSWNVGRFYDPALRGFIAPDPSGAWADSAALGNAHAYAGNSPGLARDDGRGVFVPLLVIAGLALTGGVLVGGAEFARQTVQILSDSKQRSTYDGWAIAKAAGLGAAIGAACYFLPAAALAWVAKAGVGLGALQAGHTILQVADGEESWQTAVFDVATLAIPFGLSRATPRIRAGLREGEARLYLWAMRRNQDFRAFLFDEALGRRVLELALERAVRFEIALSARMDRPRWWQSRFALTRGVETTDEFALSVGRPDGFATIVHTHPGSRRFHRLPSDGDFIGLFRRPVPDWFAEAGGGRFEEVYVLRRPGHPFSPVENPVTRTQFWSDGGRFFVRPEHPEDFAIALADAAAQGFIRRPGNGVIETIPRRLSYQLEEMPADLEVLNYGLNGYNHFYGINERAYANLS